MNKQTDNKNITEASGLTALTAQDLGIKSDTYTDVSYAIWVRALMQNWRQGTVGTKTRGEVSFSNKKPWKQKGTGRARAGSARSPLWRSGGILFGPQPRVRTLKINKQNKPQVLAAYLANMAEQGKFFAMDWEVSENKPSTSFAHSAFKNAGLEARKVVVFMDRNDHTTWASLNNLPYVHVVTFDDVNAYELSLGNCIVVMKKDVNTLKEMVAKWN
jgi:large subunit ribosomal protein L4